MKKYLSIIFISLLVVSSSCKKGYFDSLQANPNNPSSNTPDLALSAALNVAASIPNENYVWYAEWGGYLSWNASNYQADFPSEAYQFTNADYDVWTPLYGNLANWQALESASGVTPNYVAIAEVMKAYDYEQLVDNYNDVPYTQALQGSKNLTPAFDKGSAIYLDLSKKLDAAMAMMSTTAGTPTTSDIMFGGDMSKWKKFANTIKLRLCIRESSSSATTTDFATLKAAVQATSSVGYIDNTFDAEVNPGYLNSDTYGGQQSPFWITFGTTAAGGSATKYDLEYCANEYAVNFYTKLNDPRLATVYTHQNGPGITSSFPFGATNTSQVVPAGTVPDLYGTGLLIAPTMNAMIFSSAESDFLQAEAAKDGILSSDPATLYAAGITASFAQLGVSGAASYITANPYPGANAEQTIIDQKWAALIGYGALEMYNEYRRTGYPNDIPISIIAGVTTKVNVSRIYYPIIVANTNSGNLAKEGTINIFTSKIFWAK